MRWYEFAAIFFLLALGSYALESFMPRPMLGPDAPLSERLTDRGLYVYDTGAVSQPYLRQEGKRLMVNGENVQEYTYSSYQAATSEIQKMQSQKDFIGQTVNSWDAQAHVYQQGNTIVVYVGDKPNVKAALDQELGGAVVN